MARIKNTRSGAHQASLAENLQHEAYWMMRRLKRDKKVLNAQREKKKEK